jgi:hypothetical protein
MDETKLFRFMFPTIGRDRSPHKRTGEEPL